MLKRIVLGLVLLSSISFATSLDDEKDMITFVCTGNTGRSVMAEYLANYTYAFPTHGYEVQSRGVKVNPQDTSPEKNAEKVMSNDYINIAGHKATQINENDIGDSVLVLTMTDSHRDALEDKYPDAKNIHTLSECATGKTVDVLDAYGQDEPFYLKTREQIQGYLELIVKNDMQCVN